MILFIWINGCSLFDESDIGPETENSSESFEKIELDEETEIAAEKDEKEISSRDEDWRQCRVSFFREYSRSLQ